MGTAGRHQHQRSVTMHPARTRTELSFPAWPEQNLPLLVQVANGSECRDGGYPRIRGQLFSILPLPRLGCSPATHPVLPQPPIPRAGVEVGPRGDPESPVAYSALIRGWGEDHMVRLLPLQGCSWTDFLRGAVGTDKPLNHMCPRSHLYKFMAGNENVSWTKEGKAEGIGKRVP